jgi:hypothetical protein
MVTTSTRRQVTVAAVREAIEQIRAFHKVGCQSLGDLPGGDGRALDADAKRRKLTTALLRKARQFAHPEHGYSEDRLKELCRLLRAHRPEFGITHVGIMVTAPWPHRADLQRRCITESWSKSQLEDEVKKLLGPRREGGRRRRVPTDCPLVLVQLDEMADTWQRWHRQATKERTIGRRIRTVLDLLPEAVRDQVGAVTRAVERLRGAIETALDAERAKLQRRRS